MAEPQPEIAEAYVDLCVGCSSAVKTFANLQVALDEKHLVPTWMPLGGCTCLSTQIDASCPRCFPADLICRPCGQRRADLRTPSGSATSPTERPGGES